MRIGRLLGPVILVWCLGCSRDARQPESEVRPGPPPPPPPTTAPVVSAPPAPEPAPAPASAAAEADSGDKVPDIEYVPTPQNVVDKTLEVAKLSKSDVLYDLGCGDGRIVVTAAKKFGLKAFGFDVD